MSDGYTWTMAKDSKLLRLYCWYWDAKADNLNFCKLFWGVVLMLPLLPVRFAVGGGKALEKRHQAAKRAVKPASAAKPPKPPRVGPSRGDRFLTAIGAFADRIVGWFQRHRWVGKAIEYGFYGVCITVVAGGLLFLLGVVVYEFVVNTHKALVVLMWVGIGVGIFSVCVAAVFGLAFLIAETDVGDALGDFLCWIGRGFRNTWQFCVAGHHMLKSRTCPKVIVK
jgi:hypothetical protein